MGLKYKNKKIIEVHDWDDFVQETYSKPYNFQQQEGCRERGHFSFSLPLGYTPEVVENTDIKYTTEDSSMGVSLKQWLDRSPTTKLLNQKYDHDLELWWDRNFYPDFDELIQDMYLRGLLEPGEYIIIIDW